MADSFPGRLVLRAAMACLTAGPALLPCGTLRQVTAAEGVLRRLPPMDEAAVTERAVPAFFGELEGGGVFAAPGPVGRAVGERTAAPPDPSRESPVFDEPWPERAVLGEAGPTVLRPGVPGAAPWQFQILPAGLIYRSYLAGVKEPRFASVWNHEESLGWIWDISLGGRVGALRYGTRDALRPDGWQLDVEGAALLRLSPEEERDLAACDYRFGVPLTFGRGPYHIKFGYYHLSSHLGDEYMLRHPGFYRDNYVRDALVLGQSLYPIDAVRLYAEVAWAFYTSGRAKPLELQFGAEFSPAAVSGIRGAPFFAVAGHLRQEYDYSGNLVVQTGWQWRGSAGQLFRIGAQYYAGKSDQWEFVDRYEEKFGMGVWYDY